MTRKELKKIFDKELNDIMVSDELKEKTLNEINNVKSQNVFYIPYLRNVCAVFVVAFICLTVYYTNNQFFNKSFDKEEDNAIDSKLENIFMKVPILNKMVSFVDDDVEEADFLIFVLVNPKDYKEAVKNAGTIAVTVRNKLNLDHSPLVAVRNDLFTRPGTFELNIIYSDEVLEESPFNLNIIINDSDYSFIKHNSRNIASTMAARLGTWKFPIVSVKPSMLMEKPGQFEISIERGGRR